MEAMKVAHLKDVLEREPFRPFSIRLNNGAMYSFNSRREIGATLEYSMIFHFGPNSAARIDSDRIVEIIESN
jgi:hypothetical protein